MRRLLVALMLLAGCSTVGPQYIVPQDRPLSGTAPAWTPTPADVARAERGLRPYLRSLRGAVRGYEHGPPYDRLHDYARQYVGVYRNGHRVIWINLFDTGSAAYENGAETRYSDFWESKPLIR